MRKLSLLILVCLSLPMIATASTTGLKSDAAITKQGGWIPDDPEPEPTPTRYVPASSKISLPDENTCWEHGDYGKQITWQNLDGRYVKIALYRNNQFITDITSWVENSQSFSLSTVVSPSWGSGDEFQIRIENNSDPAEIIWSEEFQIMAPISISLLGNTTRWAHGQTDAQVRWSGSPGNSIKVSLYKGDEFVTDVSGWISNSGSFTIPNVSPSWGTGTNYHLLVTDDFGNEYESRNFGIDAIYVSYPNSETVWHDEERNIEILWEGGTRVIESVGLYRGSTRVLEFARLITNTGNYRWSGGIQASIGSSNQYQVRVTDDTGNIGQSERFSIQLSDDTIHGAQQLSEYSTGEFESEDDLVDYWLLNTSRNSSYLVEVDSPDLSLKVVNQNGVEIESNIEHGMMFWVAENTAPTYICVERSHGTEIDEYSLSLQMRDSDQPVQLPQFRQESFTLLGPDDTQWFKLEIPDNRLLDISLTTSEESVMKLYDDNNELVRTSNLNELSYGTRTSCNEFYLSVTGASIKQECVISFDINSPEYSLAYNWRTFNRLYLNTHKGNLQRDSIAYTYNSIAALGTNWVGLVDLVEFRFSFGIYSGEVEVDSEKLDAFGADLSLATGVNFDLSQRVNISSGIGVHFILPDDKIETLPLESSMFEYLDLAVFLIDFRDSEQELYGFIGSINLEHSQYGIRIGVGIGFGSKLYERVE